MTVVLVYQSAPFIELEGEMAKGQGTQSMVRLAGLTSSLMVWRIGGLEGVAAALSAVASGKCVMISSIKKPAQVSCIEDISHLRCSSTQRLHALPGSKQIGYLPVLASCILMVSASAVASLPHALPRLILGCLCRLAKKRTAEKRLAITVFSFPPDKGNVGTAAYLNVFGSIFRVLQDLQQQGYDVGKLPDSSDQLIQSVSGSTLPLTASVNSSSPPCLGQDRGDRSESARKVFLKINQPVCCSRSHQVLLMLFSLHYIGILPVTVES